MTGARGSTRWPRFTTTTRRPCSPSPDHGSLDDRLEPDYAAAERAIAATADAGIDADALAEHLQRQGAGAFTADWAALLTAIKEKTAKPTT